MKLSIESSGAGADLALIHGWGLGKSAWDELVPLLAPHLRVHRVELPGYDGTPAPAAAMDFVATAQALATALPAGCTLGGWSLGAQLALQADLLAPRHFGRLVLCGATPCFTQRADWSPAQSPALLERFQAALAKDPAATRQRFIALFNQGDRQARAITRTLTRALASESAPPDAATLHRGLAWLGEIDLRAQLERRATDAGQRPTHATLLIHGENDPLMPLAAAQWLATTLPCARLEVVAGAAHAPFANDPQGFSRLLIDFCHAPAVG